MLDSRDQTGQELSQDRQANDSVRDCDSVWFYQARWYACEDVLMWSICPWKQDEEDKVPFGYGLCIVAAGGAFGGQLSCFR